MTFDLAFERTAGIEGGYVNNPQDPGGKTQWGITWSTLREAIAFNVVPNWTTIETLTREQAKEIYRHFFWEPLKADALPDGVAFELFDFAVNSGIQTAVRHLQRAVGVADDGRWGPVSQKAADSMTESDIIQRLVAERLDYWTRLSTWPEFGRGWARRAATVLRYGAQDS